MQRLLNFILQNRAFFTFVVLELLCTWFIVRNNAYQSASFFNSSNAVAARMLSVSQNVNNYLHLRIVNQELSEENAKLRRALEAKNPIISRDSALLKKYDYESANVVNNSVDMFRNFITIDKGSAHGIKPGMAAINAGKAVGKVKNTSENFSVLISLINLDEQVSAVISRTANLGTLKWDGQDPRYSTLQYIPRHVNPLPGDSVVTSGLNAVFPPDIYIGQITRAHLQPNELFWDIQIELAQDFTRLQHVEVVKSLLKKEIDSLQTITTGIKK